ncbi:protease inhibitor I42 family protein [Kitasatospora sp. NPDC085895]|uniref:protease inhibitor I42 family protein n=1 Tax=Kitasatospora sp. NPDC085895 TaxID=3155057 RepID=UPI00344C8EE3
MAREGPTSEVTAFDGSVEIVLPESPTTGYRWELESENNRAHVAGSIFEEIRSSERLAGGSGMRIFHLDVLGTEPLRLTFGLRRQWDPEPIERRAVEVTFAD